MKILNIGCGNERYGTDFVDLYPTRKEVLKCNIDKDRLPYRGRVFDEVYSRGIFEHLTNHTNFFLEIKRVLKKDGKLTLITDNAFYILFWIPLSPAYQHGYKSPYGDKDRHYALFTKSHLQNWAEKFGFKVEKIETVHFFEANTAVKRIAKRIMALILPKRLSCMHLKLVARKL